MIMQELFIIYEKDISLVDIDESSALEIKIPTDLRGVVKEEIIMVNNEIAIAGAAAAIDGYALKVAFPKTALDSDIDFGVPDLKTLGRIGFNSTGMKADVRHIPDTVDLELLMMNLSVDSFALAHRIVNRVHGPEQPITLLLSAQPLDNANDQDDFNSNSDDIHFLYLARMGVFCK
jgi:hypothetical protein